MVLPRIWATSDGGRTWTPSTLATGTGTTLGSFAARNAQLACVKGGVVLAAFIGTNLTSAKAAYAHEAVRLFLARSTDGGRSFGGLTQLESSSGMTVGSIPGEVTRNVRSAFQPRLAVGPGGRVAAGWVRWESEG
jgi:hypothetical protein